MFNFVMYLSRVLGEEEDFAREEEGAPAQQCDIPEQGCLQRKMHWLIRVTYQGRMFVKKKTHVSRALSEEEGAVTYLSRVFCKEAASELEEGLQHGGVLPQPCQNDSRVQCLHICPLSPAADF